MLTENQLTLEVMRRQPGQQLFVVLLVPVSLLVLLLLAPRLHPLQSTGADIVTDALAYLPPTLFGVVSTGERDLPSPSSLPSPTPRAPRERINGTALCIVGGLRTFLLPPVYTSIHEHLVAAAPGRVDVYLFLTIGQGERADGQEEKEECSAAPLGAALELLQPTLVRVFNGISRCEQVRFEGSECCAEGSMRALAYMQLSWIDACFAEAHSRGDYSHYMRTRTDLYIGAPPPAWAFTPSHAHTLFSMDKIAPGSDMFFFFSRELLDTWWRQLSLRCTNWVNTCVRRGIAVWRLRLRGGLTETFSH